MRPNALAWLALYSLPLVVIGTYGLRRSSARLARTTAWSMILPVMFLPAGLKLPFAALDKHRIAVLSVAVALFLFHRRELRLRDGWRHFPVVILVVFCLGAVQTFLSNRDPLRFGVLKIPGLGPRDLAWMVYDPFMEFILPFAIGQRVFKNGRDVRDLLEVLSLCALAYAPFCLIEMRLSPQFSNWIYGYFAHSFIQTIRGTGYRPIVFMSHGLAVGMFMLTGLCAALCLRRAAPASRSYTKRAAVSTLVLLLARNLASVVYAAVSVVLLAWTSTRTMARAAMVLGVLVLAYPILRASDVFPATDVAGLFRKISPARTNSLVYRFTNEDALLARAFERPLYGWGGWGRSRVYTWWGEQDDPWAETRDISTTDGSWIIWLGSTGIIGLAARFATLLIPIFRFARNRGQLPESSRSLGAGLAMMVALFSIDLLPNSLWDLLPVMYAGALLSLSAPGPRSRHAAKTGWTSVRTSPHEVTSSATGLPPMHA